MYLSANEVPTGCAGLGCAGMGGLTMDGSGIFGTGIFGAGVTLTDFSTWGPGEIGAVAVAAFVLFSVVNTTRHGAQNVREGYTTARRKTRAFSRA